MNELLSRLQSELGDAVELREPKSSDSIDGLAPQIVAAPREETAAHHLVAWCGREKIAFVAAGGATKLEIGASPNRFDLRISTEYLTQVHDFDPGNATIKAGAGISLEQLNAATKDQRQFVPLDFPTGATLGGTVAANSFGASKLKYGAPRDLVTGLHAALSDGRLVKAGAKVVKNVSGYDLPKIFTGSFGTLGLLTRVTIRLRPFDAASQIWTQRFDSWSDLQEKANFIFNGNFEPTSLRTFVHENQLVLQAKFDGGEQAVKSQIARLEPSDESAPDANWTNAQWIMRAHLPVQAAANWAQQSGARSLVWDCGLGVVRAQFEEDCPIEKLRAEAEKQGGFLIIERAPHCKKTPDLVWGTPRSDSALMRRLKAAFDPNGVCAPGRFIGGI